MYSCKNNLKILSEKSAVLESAQKVIYIKRVCVYRSRRLFVFIYRWQSTSGKIHLIVLASGYGKVGGLGTEEVEYSLYTLAPSEF